MTPSSNDVGSELRLGPPLRTIVVALDSSPGAAHVFSSALRMTRTLPSATLHVVHVFRSSRFDHARPGVPATPASMIDEAKEQHLESFVRAARREGRPNVSGHFAIGDPATEIIRFCSEHGADLLIVGTHDHQGLERLLLGSIAETLVRKARCTVLVVRPALRP